jgi:hypothetical protein
VLKNARQDGKGMALLDVIPVAHIAADYTLNKEDHMFKTGEKLEHIRKGNS